MEVFSVEQLKYKAIGFMPPRRKRKETDVLIVGEGLIGTLTAYFFYTSHVPCILLDLPAKREATECQLDEELTQLSHAIDPAFAQDLFHSVIDSIYTLDRLMDLLEKESCEYQRNPQLHYLRETKEGYAGYALEAGLLVYQSGVTFNPQAFKQQLLAYLKREGLEVIDGEVETVSLSEKATLLTDDSWIEAKKLVVASPSFYQRFFPGAGNSVSEEGCDTYFVNYGSVRIFETSSHLPHYNLDISEAFIERFEPLIGEHPFYPHVYFNVGHYHLLNGLIGSHLVQQLYLQKEMLLVSDIKFSTF